MIVNKRFNRYEKGGHHFYRTEFPPPTLGDVAYRGLIKCKLAHGLGYSIIVPDQLYLQLGGSWAWIQPLFFTACQLGRYEEVIWCSLMIDIAHGHRLSVLFRTDQLKFRMDDGGQVFECEITGPRDLADYATGRAYVGTSIEIDLYHHTTKAAQRGILDSKHFRCSKWNIQGTKELKNVGYVYLTCLDQIEADEDLQQIAMATDAKIHLLVDNGDPQNPMHVVTLDVYRERTLNRRHTINSRVAVEKLAPSHLWKHAIADEAVYYEVSNPFIYRVGIQPIETLPIVNGVIGDAASGCRRFEYVVVGDAKTRDGMKAPYDEEDTKQILKIESPPTGVTLLDFWFTFPNQDHFSGKDPAMQQFNAALP